MKDTSLNSIKARYKELFPLACSKEDFIKSLDFFRTIEDKRIIVNSNDINYKPSMVAFLTKYLSTHDRYPNIMVFNAHEISEIYITGSQDGNLLRLSDINADILFLTAGYSEPNNKSLKDCIGFIMNNYVLQDKYLFLYLKGSSMLIKDIESLGKSLNLPFYNLSKISYSKKNSKPSNKPSNGSQMSLF